MYTFWGGEEALVFDEVNVFSPRFNGHFPCTTSFIADHSNVWSLADLEDAANVRNFLIYHPWKI